MRTALALLAGALLLAGAAMLSWRLAAEKLNRPYDLVHVPSGRTARIAALGQRGLVSDLYWLSTVQYIGDPRADARGYDRLYELVDLVTDLDPRHGYAYQTAGIVLSAAGRLDESDAILQKGIDEGPRWWTYPYYISFNYWFYRGDYETGARYAEQAARTPGASANVSQLALSLKSKTGSPEDAIAMIRGLRAAVKDEATAARLDEQLKLAFLEADAQRLERAEAEFERQRGRRIVDLQELVAAGLVPELPPDPFGGRYVWDAAERKVHSNVNPFRFTLREGAHHPKFKYQVPGARAKGATR